MIKFQSFLSTLKDPINLILIYIIFCSVISARFVTANDQTKDIALIIFLLLVLAIYIVYNCQLDPKRVFSKVFTWPNQIILAYLAWSLITLGFAIDKKVTLFYIIGGFIVFLAGFVVSRDLLNKDKFKNILSVVAVSGLIPVAYTLLALLLGVSSTGFDPAFARINLIINSTAIYNLPFLSSYFEHPNTFGIALFFSISSCLALILLEKNKILRIGLYLGAVLSTVALVLTFSRTSVLATTIFAVLIGYWALRTRNYLVPAFSVVLVIITALFTFGDYQIFMVKQAPAQKAITPLSEGAVEVTTKEKTDSEKPKSGKKIVKAGLSNREVLWQSSLKYIKENPIIGAGLGNSEKAIAEKIPTEKEDLAGLTPHNTYLRIGVESAIAGLVIYLALIFYFLKDFLLKLKKIGLLEFATFSVVFSYLILQLFEANFLLGTGFKSFYFLVFLASGVALINRKTYEDIDN